jgi:alkylation response protein AidB-like acyl-CoA dehydrogenase
MHLDLTTDQDALRDATAQLCAGLFPSDSLRAVIDGGLDQAVWRKLTEAGVFHLRRPESEGGVGLGLTEAVLVFEELGRALVPGPLVATHLTAGVIPGADPADIVGMAPTEPDGSLFVEHLDSLDWLVVMNGVPRLVPGDEARAAAGPPLRPLDPLTRLARLSSAPAGGMLGGPGVARRWERDGALLVAAQAAGLSAAMVDVAARYAAERRQFDRPIGSFQAVKHLLADMLTRAEMARVAVEVAAVTIDQPGTGDPEAMVHTAKVVAGEAATANGRACVQIHGGMGFAWEVDAHLYLKRAWALDHQFGSAKHHATALADL